jgi:SM-20-related protein
MHTPDFDAIADALTETGYCILPDCLPLSLSSALHQRVIQMEKHELQQAGVGRQHDFHVNQTIRSDYTRWLTEDNETDHAYLKLMESFRLAINQRLFLGLFDYEAHFAHYPKGAFYQKHVDAFRGRSNRVLTTVTYLNPKWDASNGGELLLYSPDGDSVIETIQPEMGKLVIFLSEQFPHEVKPAGIDRYSIAGWFRIQNG